MKQKHFSFTQLRKYKTTFSQNTTMRVFSILICCFMALSAVAQQKKTVATQQRKPATSQQRKTTVTQTKQTTFEFKMQWDASFKKDGEDNFYVVNFGRKSAHQLYMDVLSHIASIYKNPDYVTSKVEDRSIVINGYASEIAYFKDSWGDYYSAGFKYRLELQFKEGKIRVNAPTTLDVYAEGTSKIKKFSDCALSTDGLFYLFEAEKKNMLNEINKYINTLITTIVYGSKDDNW